MVAAYFLYSASIVPTSIDSTANLELMHIQSVQFAIGIGAAVISAVLAVGAAIVGAIRPDD
jgi:hypothetical protein